MRKLFEEIAELMKDAGTSPLLTAVPGLSMIKGDIPKHQLAALYKPMIGFTVQGKKVLSIGGRDTALTGPTYYVLPTYVPATATVHPSADGRPYMSIGLEIDHEILQSLLIDIVEDLPPQPAPQFAPCEFDAAHMEAWLRLLRLLKTPREIPALAPVYKREILYRVLKGPQGMRLRQLGLKESNLSRIAKTVEWLRHHFMKPIDVRSIAREAGMAVTTFHRQFKNATGLSPIQFQKQLRLLEAKNLIAFEGYAVTSAAYEVGYESPSQFNREYSRFFGASPARHSATIRTSLTPELTIGSSCWRRSSRSCSSRSGI